METATERTEWVYLIVTILKTKNSYLLRKRKPKSLAPNEICYAFQVTIDKEEWFGRINEYELPKARPPEAKIHMVTQVISKPTAQLVMDRITGKEGAKTVEKDIVFIGDIEKKAGIISAH